LASLASDDFESGVLEVGQPGTVGAGPDVTELAEQMSGTSGEELAVTRLKARASVTTRR
jgi:hypothetical protein